jgi:hypothetical protein
VALCREFFPVGCTVRIIERPALKAFARQWKDHHKPGYRQYAFAGRETTVKAVSFFYRDEALYELQDIPGLWLEGCLRAI